MIGRMAFGALAFACAGQIVLTHAASAQTAPGQSRSDMAVMLDQAQRFTVRVRSTVSWPFAPEQPGTSFGTGFIVDLERGWILTNAHVARRSHATVEVSFGESEAQWLAADKVYVDNHLDIAVLKLSGDRLPAETVAAKLGCDAQVKQGASVVAYGHPVNLSFTATRGIISSVRTMNSHEFVQMDANINPGNSGGPLLSVDAAEVVGVNTAGISGAPGLGLALAIRHVCPVLALLAKGQEPGLPMLPYYWQKKGMGETLMVAAEFPGGGALAGAGLRAGDVIVAISGGQKLGGLPDLFTALRGRSGSVQLDIKRDGQKLTVEAPLLPAEPPMQRRAVVFSGLLAAEPAVPDAPDSSLPKLRIDFVRPGETASRIGLRPGDMLDRVGGQRFLSVTALHEWLKSRKERERISLIVRRRAAGLGGLSAEYHSFDLQVADLRLLGGPN